MKTLATFVHDPVLGRKEVLELRDLLAAKPDLKEKKDILPFFRKRLQLSGACGFYYNAGVLRPDRLAWEYDLFGDFACDLVVGDWAKKNYTFVEFEDAGPKSLFVHQGKRTTRAWSPRLDQGYGQIIDWFYKLDDRRNSDDCEARFGKCSIDYFRPSDSREGPLHGRGRTATSRMAA